jgi:small subunit ribosomal protein S1
MTAGITGLTSAAPEEAEALELLEEEVVDLEPVAEAEPDELEPDPEAEAEAETEAEVEVEPEAEAEAEPDRAEAVLETAAEL